MQVHRKHFGAWVPTRHQSSLTPRSRATIKNRAISVETGLAPSRLAPGQQSDQLRCFVLNSNVPIAVGRRGSYIARNHAARARKNFTRRKLHASGREFSVAHPITHVNGGAWHRLIVDANLPRGRNAILPNPAFDQPEGMS